MSKQRAQRRAEREHEAAIKAAARAAEVERRERRGARVRAVRSRVPRFGIGKHQGLLARRRRIQNFVLVDIVLVLNIVTWFVTESGSARALVLVATVLSFPVLKTLMFPR